MSLGRQMWYGLDHEPISVEEADELLRDGEARRVAFDEVDGWTVSTIFLVLDHGWLPGAPPVLYETMAFCPEGHAEMQDRYHTRVQAVAGHDQMLAHVRDGDITCSEEEEEAWTRD